MSVWSRLSHGRQLKIALSVAARRGEELRTRYSGVMSVGAGFRSRKEETELSEEVCLRFLVDQKRGAGRLASSAIPKSITTYASIGGKRLRVDVPTDVSEFSQGQPHAFEMGAGIVSRDQGHPVDYGAVCCLVRNSDSPGERYLLSCYHVFSPGLNELPGQMDCVYSGNNRAIGPLLDVADPYSPDGLDAGLVFPSAVTMQAVSLWGRQPVARATEFDLTRLTSQSPLFVCGRRVAPATGGIPATTRTAPLPARFQSYFPNPVRFNYQATTGQDLFFAGTLQYRADVRPGDSGSALMSNQGVLYGMHFYGYPGTGFAFAAPRLFESGIFPFDIELAT